MTRDYPAIAIHLAAGAVVAYVTVRFILQKVL